MTGLIYVAIIGLWAAVLLPMWLRRHDAAQARVHVDRHGRAMGALASSADDDERVGRAIIHRRRLLTAGILGTVALVALVGWVVGVVPTWAVIIGLLPVLAYGASLLASGRLRARDEERRARERSRAARAARRGAHAPRRASAPSRPQRTPPAPIPPTGTVAVVRSPRGSGAPQPDYEKVFDQTA